MVFFTLTIIVGFFLGWGSAEDALLLLSLVLVMDMVGVANLFLTKRFARGDMNFLSEAIRKGIGSPTT